MPPLDNQVSDLDICFAMKKLHAFSRYSMTFFWQTMLSMFFSRRVGEIDGTCSWEVQDILSMICRDRVFGNHKLLLGPCFCRPVGTLDMKHVQEEPLIIQASLSSDPDIFAEVLY